MTKDGYPTEEDIAGLRAFSGTPRAFVEYVESLWHWRDLVNWVEAEGRLGRKVMKVTMVTGGWSGNETIIDEIEHTVFGFLFWESSHRGGLHVYHVGLESWEHESKLGRLIPED